MKAVKAFLLLAFLAMITVKPAQAGSEFKGGQFALIVADPKDSWFTAKGDQLYNVLSTDYEFYSVTYLKGSAVTKANVRNAIKNLVQTCQRIDFVFIYIICHGGGWDKKCARQYPYDRQFVNCRVEQNSDEGLEANEAMFYPDGDPNKWYGIDESLRFTGSGADELYWDDELAEDLAGLKCWRLVFVYTGCAMENSTEHCFSGGLIDDLSAPNRIIITASNETAPANYNPFFNDNWDDLFISAFDKGSSHFYSADKDGDGKVSFKEAFDYATNNAWSKNLDSPWLDDNGNRQPTFILGEDHLDPDDGSLASQTFLDNELYFWVEADINGDGCVNIIDAVLLGAAFGSKEGDPNWNPDCDLNHDGYINVKDAAILGIDFGLHSR